MSNYEQYCNKDGLTLMGSDSVIYFDGRWGRNRRDNHAAELRKRYKKNFKHKYDSMTHYTYKGSVYPVQEIKQ